MRRTLWGLGLLALGGALGLAGAIVADPGRAARAADRLRRYAARAEVEVRRQLPERPLPAARLVCAPAVSVGPAGAIPALEALAPETTISAVVHWPTADGVARRERAAVDAVVREARGSLEPLDARTVVATAHVGGLRRARAAAPSAAFQFPVSGTRALCIATRPD